MKPIDVLMATGAIPKTSTLATAFHRTIGEENPYVLFVYGPLTICNHTQGQVSGSMNSDPINMIHKSKKPTKYGLSEDIEGYFRSGKAIN